MFTKIPKINAHATVVIVTCPKFNANPPTPATRITEITNTFLLSSKSTFLIIFNPDTAIKPYNRKHTAFKTQDGIVDNNALTGPINETAIAINAATKIEITDAFLVRATQPTDSPYEVVEHPPRNAPAASAKPSPINVLCKPGSFNKSDSIIVD